MLFCRNDVKDCMLSYCSRTWHLPFVQRSLLLPHVQRFETIINAYLDVFLKIIAVEQSNFYCSIFEETN